VATILEHFPEVFPDRCLLLRGFLKIDVPSSDVDRDPRHLDFVEVGEEPHPLAKNRLEFCLSQLLLENVPKHRQMADILERIIIVRLREIITAPIRAPELDCGFVHLDG
jgi:hypothetical protein